MITASRLAGFFTAHAVWCVSDGDTLIPILGYTTDHGERKMERLIVQDDLQSSVERGKQKLYSNEMDANDAVLLYDGRITLDSGKLDAIIVEIRSYFALDAVATLAVPYTPKASGSFRVHRPKIVEWKGCADFDMNEALQAFFDGVDSHERGAAVWSAFLDESK